MTVESSHSSVTVVPAAHIDSFDGIRGLAVLLVMMGHAGWFADGWVGVDLFFVLSGYLITRILRRTKDERYPWRRFYIKRVTRIFPPLLLSILIVGLFWPHVHPATLLAYLLSFANIADVTGFYVWPLEHLWSLSVEEHFYLLWPFAVFYLPRRKLRWLLLALVIVVPLSRLAFTYLLPRHAPNYLYYLTPFRIDGIALGSLLAVLLEKPVWNKVLSRWAAPGAVACAASYLILWTMLGHSHFFPFAYSALFNSIGYWLVAVIAFCVVAFAQLHPDAVPTRILRLRWLRGLGTISYGVYVYSWIVLQFAWRLNPHSSPQAIGIAHMIVSVAVAAVLFHYYEAPITRWGKHVASRIGVSGGTREIVV